jgi:hypothetical protein
VTTVAFDPEDAVYVVPLPSTVARRRRQLHLSVRDGDWKHGDADACESLQVGISINGMPFELIVHRVPAAGGGQPGRDGGVDEAPNGVIRVRGESYEVIQVLPVHRR